MDRTERFALIASQLDASLISATPLHGGVSATVFRLDLASAAGEQSVVYREHDSAIKHADGPTFADLCRKEFAVISALAASAFPVAQPLLLAVDQHYLVTDFVAGTTEVEDLDAAMTAMASFLARLHSLDTMSLRHRVGQLEDPVAELPNYLPASSVGDDLRRVLDAGVDLASNPRVLIHGDYWPGNVLWHDGELAAVIDWEDAAFGDPLADLACARVELLCAYGTEAMDAFTASYLDMYPLVLDALPLWEAYVSATALHSMHSWGLDPADEAARRATTTAFFETSANQLR